MKPSWYIPYSRRAGLSAEDVADSQQWDDETGETARRIREADKASRDWQATHPKTESVPTDDLPHQTGCEDCDRYRAARQRIAGNRAQW